MPGNITDVSTLKTTVKSLDSLGAANIHLVLDRGFYSIDNINELYRRRHKFTIALPTGRKWVEAYLDKHRDNIASPVSYLSTGENEALYTATELHKWGQNKHRGYLHLYYNAERAASDFDRFTRKLISYRDELLSEKPLKEHEDFYQRYLIVRKTPKRGLRVSYNEEEIRKYRDRYSGFVCIYSNTIKRAVEALYVYRNKDVVENCFDDLKNQLDMKRLRVHSATAMDCRLFLQFLSLVYISTIRNTIEANNKLKYLTAREVMEEMETLTRIKYSNRYGQIFTETTAMQRCIMEAFDLKIPT
jgi:transposase